MPAPTAVAVATRPVAVESLPPADTSELEALVVDLNAKLQRSTTILGHYMVTFGPLPTWPIG